MGDYFQFDFYKKKIIKLVFKKNQNRTVTGSNRPVLVLVRLFYNKNLVQTGLARFFPGLALFFSSFDSVFSVSGLENRNRTD